MKLSFKKVLPHLIVLLLFAVVSVVYFHPILQGKQILQSDIIQYKGMSNGFKTYNKTAEEITYWNDNAFGGMPTYQLGAQYPHNYIKKVDRVLRFLPRPADYVFLYFLGFYVLLLVFKLNWKYALLGSLAFGMSTYFIIILGVGHNAKAHAIAYFPLVLAGIFLAFQKRYITGFLVTALAMGLEISANHFQMTYYLLLLVLVIGVVYLVDAFKNKELPHFFKAVGGLTLAVLLSLAMNATNLMATSEYAKFSTRSKSELTIDSNGKPKTTTTGLDKAYITEYSYGIGESLNLFVPRLYGGSNNEPIEKDAESVKMMKQLFRGQISTDGAQKFSGQLMYWADQGYVAAPAYLGAVVVFLFILALFTVQGKMRRWVVIGGILTLFLSWGKNFNFLTDLFIDYFPFYNKFRAVSSIQVIVELLVPLFGIVGLYRFVQLKDKESQKRNLFKATAITAGLAVLFLVGKGIFFDFTSPRDMGLIQKYGPDFIEAIKAQRETLFTNDVLRTLAFVLLAATTLWMFIKNKISEVVLLLVLGLFVMIDLVGVDKRYVNAEDFVNASKVERPFEPTSFDLEILKDKGHYRVLDFSNNPFNTGRTSYFHKAFGGYHAAKPKRAQDLFDFYIMRDHVGVMNMLNIKYKIELNKQKRPVIIRNPYANGNAWFIRSLQAVGSADEELIALSQLDLKNEAVVNANVYNPGAFVKDSLASITLSSYKPHELVYTSSNANDGYAVFSEMFYKNGWEATIDGKVTPIQKVNYALRGLAIPKGSHEIIFKFNPKVVKTGSTIALIASIIFFLLLIVGGYLLYNANKKRN